ncbi:AAA family ATPase [Marinobacter sp. SBS5]|uniref:AAA family ATPase n=1 Tax=Marinobacter sp. SBS5 TaxID=3401754 RepID=UPI003AADF0DA
MAQDTLSSLDGGGLFPRLQQRYGLSENPLEMDSPFFPGAMRQHALETLRHLSGFGDMALVVTGAPGAGKTRVLTELVRSESARLDFHHVPVAALTSAAALARELKSLTRSAIPEDFEPREAVYRYFSWSESRVERGRRQVLLVDDADRCPPDVLNLILSAFVAADRTAAAVPVFAGSEAVERVLSSEPDAGYVHHLALPPLDKDDVFAYLEPRVNKTGGSVDELLSSCRLKQIHALSQGSLGRLKRVTPGVWLDMVAGSHGVSRFNFPSIQSLRWPALAVLLLGISWWLVSLQYDQAVENLPDQSVAPERVRKSITIGPESAIEENEGAVIAEHDAALAVPAERVTAVGEAPQAPETEPSVVRDVPQEPAKTVEEPEPEPEPTFTPVLPERFVALERLQQSQGWTLQLVAGRLEQTVLNVLGRLPEDKRLRYTVGERDGQPWFMLVYGSYATRNEAESAAATLPEALKVDRPWIRTYESF